MTHASDEDRFAEIEDRIARLTKDYNQRFEMLETSHGRLQETVSVNHQLYQDHLGGTDSPGPSAMMAPSTYPTEAAEVPRERPYTP